MAPPPTAVLETRASKPTATGDDALTPGSKQTAAMYNELTTLSLRPITDYSYKISQLEILVVICITHVCVGFAMGSVSPAMEPVTSHFHLSDSWRGILGAASLAGNIAGSPMGGSIADLWGRRVCLLSAWVVLMLSTLMQGLSMSIQQLCFARALVGWAVGAHYGGVTTYLSETLDPAKSGSLMSLTELHFFIGNFLSIAIGAAFKYSISDRSLRWRLTLALPCIPVLLTLIWFYLRAPETRSWLDSRRRTHLPFDTIQPGSESEAFYSAAAVPASQQTEDVPARSNFKKNLLFCSIFWGSLVVPTFAVSAFAVTIIQDLHTSVDPFLMNTFLGGAIIIGVIAGCFLVDRWGRKELLLTSQWGVAGVFAMMAIVKPFVREDSTLTVGVLIGLFMIFEMFSGCGGPLSLIYPAELFAPRIKGIASGLAAMNSRFMAVAAILLMSFGLSKIGVAGTLGTLGVFSACCAICTHILAPKKSSPRI